MIGYFLKQLAGFGNRISKGILRRLGMVVDFMRYKNAFTTYRGLVEGNRLSGGRVLFVAGRGMNIGWAQIWPYLSLGMALQHIEPCVLLFRNQWIIRLYFGLVSARVYFLDEINVADSQGFDIGQLTDCATVLQWKALRYKNMPIGQMALSTYCRYHATGFIDPLHEPMKRFAAEWVQGICKAYDYAINLYQAQKISTVVFTETFIEEYGGFYYAALAAGLDVIKTSGTVRDNAIVVQRRSEKNERLHHAALTEQAWVAVKQLDNYARIKNEVDKNFSERYGDKWFRSQRNHKNTQIVTREQGRELLGVRGQRKVVVVFSHILYDALFHYGDELFQDYATWLIETIKVAIKNPKVDWFIKLHPSNLWRGEFLSMLGGKYEEEKIIDQYIGVLPPHVRLVYADTTISPFGWYQIADYGISVRGTAGLEMACLGKPVVTAGTGRYEGKGFTVDPVSVDDYRTILLELPALEPLPPAQTELAIRYAHGLFNMKPFVLGSLEPKLKFGKRHVLESDDIAYLPLPHRKDAPLPCEILRFADYIADKQQIDLLREA